MEMSNNIHQGYPTENLVRFLKGRDANVSNAYKVLIDCLNWRIQNEIDNILAVSFNVLLKYKHHQLVGLSGYSKEMKYLKPLNLFQELLKSNEIKKSRLLGLDVGYKYVGLAVSDVENKIASPLSVLLRKKMSTHLMAADLESLISELNLAGFVIGYPFDRQKSSSGGVQVKLFTDDLHKTGKFEELKYTFWDECFTSKNVDFLLKPLNLHPVLSKTITDKFAAVGILQGYLDFVNMNPSLKSTE